MAEETHPPIPCRHLRTKLFAMHQDIGRAYLEEAVATEHYWCTWTMGPAGPDDRPAEPLHCTGRRGCYRSMGPRAEDRP